MASARSYSFAATIAVGSSTTRLAGEFHAPNVVHELITVAGRTVEVTFIGRRAFTRDATSGRWSSIAGQPAHAAADPRSAFAVLAGTQGATAAGPTITFRLPAAAASQLLATNSHRSVSSVHGEAVVVPDGLSHLEYAITTDAGQVRIVVEYTDINTAAPISAPTAA